MGKSSRSKKAAPAQKGGVAVMERPAGKTSTRDKAVERLKAKGFGSQVVDPAPVAASVAKLVAGVLKKADAEAFDKLAAKLQPAAAKPDRLSAPAAGDMVATYYLRTSGAMKGSFGALLQTPEMKGTLKGRQCRHPHSTAAEAIGCARAMASATKAA